MPLRHLIVAPAAAHASVQPLAAAGVSAVTPERIWAVTAALLALAGVVVGGLALFRRTGRTGRLAGGTGSVAALAAGLIAVVNGGLVVVTADGGLGTGNGIAGGYVALALGLVAMTLGGLALAPSRRDGHRP
ncbi:DUF6223 family protein [Streptomyces sp. KHY 26]|uniref:DUF6223 family protein n=1 Tax=Streptomyces sp. KHY 26 TaxID=3097359 RepID=UPI00376ECAFA